MKTSLIAGLGIVALVAAACGGDDGATTTAQEGGADAAPVEVVASFYPLAEAAERVGGDRVRVTNLTPAGAEPHDIELNPRQVESILGADVVLVMGRGFQPAVERLAERSGGLVVELLEQLPIDAEGEVAEDSHDDEDDEDDGHGEGALDPHVWLDPTLMSAIVDEVVVALSEVDPDGAEAFEANGEDFAAELADLDERYQEALADCRHDLIVVQHEAFGWMTDRYGLRQEGIAGLSPEQEPNPRRMAELVELVQEEGINVVFTETLVSPRVAEALAREAGVETLTLNPLEGLTDEQRAAGESFTSIMDGNLDNLVTALECS
ncbi:MAG TPA: zinc ABC transporter substrate-binding protein [Acidimicrobiales bacterium]|nr:zinc ABC transporter substrate-binding protein [Acidimicrobiales bacterium]